MMNKSQSPTQKTKFATRIKQLRKDFLELTQLEIAEALEISQSVVSQYESGRTIPTLDVIERLCEKFPQINPLYLLGEEPDISTQSQPLSIPEMENKLHLMQQREKSKSFGPSSSLADSLRNNEERNNLPYALDDILAGTIPDADAKTWLPSLTIEIQYLKSLLEQKDVQVQTLTGYVENLQREVKSKDDMLEMMKDMLKEANQKRK